ncbi:hypothetical protein ACPCBC_11700 [Streptomyces incarnatus]|nr:MULTISPECIES: hypothetical protein [Streptomyces]
MDTLLVAGAFNGLCRRVYAELSDRAHRADVVLAARGAEPVRAAVRERAPDLVVAPMPTTALPEGGWRERPCPIVHPGPPGEQHRPSAPDRAVAGRPRRHPDLGRRIAAKAAPRAAGERHRPLATYRRAELARMHAPFLDPHAPYHALRSAFVRRTPTGSPRLLAAPADPRQPLTARTDPAEAGAAR